VGEPLAYFITFRTHGSWLPGDRRGYTVQGSKVETPLRPPGPGLVEYAGWWMENPPVRLTRPQRDSVAQTLERVASVRGWVIHGQNVRTNHVHLVISAPEPPTLVMNSLKSWATRDLRAAALVGPHDAVWARHGSTRYLWDESAVSNVWTYIVYGQDKPGPPPFDAWGRWSPKEPERRG
jgi:REP element-mobilizing transposase RayT